MQISKISFGENKIQQNSNKKETFLDKFATNARNYADMTDTVVVPRTIFKGYLEFIVGTALLTAGNLIKKPSWLRTSFIALGTAVTTYGAYSFVRPFIIKDTPGVQQKK